MEVHTHEHRVVHAGVWEWTVDEEGRVEKFTRDAPCSDPVRDGRGCQENAVYFFDLFADWKGVPVKSPPRAQFSLPTGELLFDGHVWTWLSFTGWSTRVTLPRTPVAAAGWFLLAWQGEDLTAWRFEPPTCSEVDFHTDPIAANEYAQYHDCAWAWEEPTPPDWLRLYKRHAVVQDGQLIFRGTGTESAGIRTSAASIIVRNDTVVADIGRHDSGTNWTTWRVRGSVKHAVCHDYCFRALVSSRRATERRTANRLELFIGFLICAHGLEGHEIKTQLAIQFLLRVTSAVGGGNADLDVQPVQLAWLAFILLQERRHLDIRRIVQTLRPLDGQGAFIHAENREAVRAEGGLRGLCDQFWRVVQEYQQACPLTNAVSASFALAMASPCDPEHHSVFLSISPQFPRTAENAFAKIQEYGVHVPHWDEKTEPSVKKGWDVEGRLQRDLSFNWADERWRHELLRTLATCAATHLFRYPPWARMLELQWDLQPPTERALRAVPLQVARYKMPTDAKLRATVEEELWVFFHVAFVLANGMRTDAGMGTSSLSVAMRVRSELTGVRFKRFEYLRMIHPILARRYQGKGDAARIAAADRIRISPRLASPSEFDTRSWLKRLCADTPEIVERRELERAVLAEAVPHGVHHTPQHILMALRFALGGHISPLFADPLWSEPRRYYTSVEPLGREGVVFRSGWKLFRDIETFTLPRLARAGPGERADRHVPPTVLRVLWCV